MAYVLERDDLEQEVTRGLTSEVVLYAKDVEGKAVSASATAADNVVAVFDRRGTLMIAEAQATRNVALATGSRLELDVPTDSTWRLEYGYEARWRWRIAGETTERRSVTRFGVVARRWLTDVSLNDLQDRVSWIGQVLTTIAGELGLSTPDRAAATFAYRARVVLEQALNQRISAEGRTRATLIVDRVPLRNLQADKAVELCLRSSAKRPDAEDRNWRLADYYQRRYEEGLSALGPLDYDTDQDAVADDVRRPGLVLCTR